MIKYFHYYFRDGHTYVPPICSNNMLSETVHFHISNFSAIRSYERSILLIIPSENFIDMLYFPFPSSLSDLATLTKRECARDDRQLPEKLPAGNNGQALPGDFVPVFRPHSPPPLPRYPHPPPSSGNPRKYRPPRILIREIIAGDILGVAMPGRVGVWG